MCKRGFTAATLLLIALAFGTGQALAEDSPGFDNMTAVTYSDLFTLAVQQHQNGHLQDSFGTFQRLACAGDKASQEQLGLMYLNGEGVKRSTLKGYLWLKVAAEFSLATYHANVTRLEALFSEQQKKETAPLADDLRGRYGLRATNITCNAESSSTFSSNIKDTAVCSPKRNGSMLMIHRCYADDVPAVAAAEPTH